MTEKRKDYFAVAPTSTKHRTGAKILKISDFDKVFEYFFVNTATMLDAEKALHVMRPCICRYVAALEREGRIQCLTRKPDSTTGYKAKHYSSDPTKWTKPQPRQLNLWEGNL